MWAFMNLLKDNKRIVDYFYEEHILQKVYTQLNHYRNKLGVNKVTITLTETFCRFAKAYFEVRPFLLASAMTPFLDEFFNVFCDVNGYFDNVQIEVLAIVQIFFLNIPESEIQHILLMKSQDFISRLLYFLQSEDDSASRYAAKIVLDITSSKDPIIIDLFSNTQLLDISRKLLAHGNYAITMEILSYLGNIMGTPCLLCEEITKSEKLLTEIIQKLDSSNFESEALRFLYLLTINGQEAVHDLLLSDLHLIDILVDKMKIDKSPVFLNTLGAVFEQLLTIFDLAEECFSHKVNLVKQYLKSNSLFWTRMEVFDWHAKDEVFSRFHRLRYEHFSEYPN